MPWDNRVLAAYFFSAADYPLPVASKALSTSAWAYSSAYYVASLIGVDYGAAASLLAGAAGAYFGGSSTFSGAFSVVESVFSVESVIVVSLVYSASTV